MTYESISDAEKGVGLRLRTAREAQGLTREEVAARMKVPVRVVQSLEEEDWARLGAPVFVRGQLRSYSRLLGLVTSTTLAASGLSAPIEPTKLEPRSYAAGEVGRVTLGNASAVVVQQGDRPQDTTPFRRANVARFTVSSDGSLSPVRD